jgi:hypothetical protein
VGFEVDNKFWVLISGSRYSKKSQSEIVESEGTLTSLTNTILVS